MGRQWLLAFGLMIAGLVGARDSASQDGAETTEARNCVDLMRIERTEVVDDDTVLFYMRGRHTVRNA